MKLNFKYVSMLLCTALMAGFTSCSNNDDEAPVDLSGTHRVTLKTRVVSGATRAEAPSAVGVKPEFNDLYLFFVGDNRVQVAHKISDLTAVQNEGEQIVGIPNVSNCVYAIGNSGIGAMAAALDAVEGVSGTATSEEALKAILFDLAAQGGGSNDHAKVNLQGAMTYTPVLTGNTMLQIDLTPAISRVEIQNVAAKTVVADGITADKEVNTFELAGIYVNNTFEKVGLDYAERVSPIAYGKDATAWTDGSYNTNFCDVFTGKTAANTYSATTNQAWGYYVAPLAVVNGELNGTTIDGAMRAAVPMVVCALKNVVVNSAPIAEPRYVIVTKYKDQNDNQITSFEPGKVYQIASIKFDAENLNEEPVPTPTDTHDVVATVTVKPWEGVNTTPDL